MQASDSHPDLHQGHPIRMAGERIDHARAAMLMVHGRGARAEDILTLTDHLTRPGFVFLAPQAAGDTWYPNPFSAELSSNEPWLTSALMRLGEVLAQTTEAGIPLERTVLLGFSQGASLTLEFAARNARRYGGLVGLSGSLIGPASTPRLYSGSLDSTPVFLGCSDVDPYIPKERVNHTAIVLGKLGGKVTERLYPDMGHMVNQDELDFVRQMMKDLP